MKYIPIIILSFLVLNLSAQKKVLLDRSEDIEKAASDEFKLAMTPPEGSLYIFGQDHNIQGVYAFKISVGDKSKVTSVFVLDREGGEIKMQNRVKDAVKDFKFNTFKVPKGKHYNIKYTFNFN